jgi:glutamine synthetase
MVNPYLLLAVQIAAGLDGIESVLDRKYGRQGVIPEA